MHLDISLDSFDPRNHHLRVPHEQGHILVDAALNLQTAILLHRLQTLAADIFGNNWGPPDKLPGGFKITWDGVKKTLTIGAGRYYVAGLLCENDLALDYTKQDDYPYPEMLPADVPFLVYLDVWERVLTELTHSELRDIGLENIPGYCRTKLIWQVRAKQIPLASAPLLIDESKTPRGSDELKKAIGESAPDKVGLLRAKSSENMQDYTTSVDPCGDDSSAQPYRGAENQYYRVEIHRSGKAFEIGGPANQEPTVCATFKWSRDNGSVAYPIDKDGWPDPDLLDEQKTDLPVTLRSAGYDDRTQLKLYDWLEYVDEITVLNPPVNANVHLVKRLFQIVEIDHFEPTKIKLRAREASDWILPKAPVGFNRRAFLRRWDQQPELNAEKDGPILSADESMQADDNALLVVAPGKIGAGPEYRDEWVELEDGVRVQFSAGSYRRGDYWRIPARAASGSVLWKFDDKGRPEFLAPTDTPHYYAALAIVGTLDTTDCRRVVAIDGGVVKVNPA